MNYYNYFDFPTQVKYWDKDGGYLGGIAYQNVIITGLSGTPIEITEVYQNTPHDVKAIIPYEYWVDLSAEIIGE